MTRTTQRFAADFILATMAFFAPWWIVLLCAAVLFFTFDRFVELFFLAFLMDMLYGSPLSRFWGFEFVLSAGAAMLYLVLTLIKKRIRI